MKWLWRHLRVCVCGNAGEDKDGQPVYLREIWPSREEILVKIHFSLVLVSIYREICQQFFWRLNSATVYASCLRFVLFSVALVVRELFCDTKSVLNLTYYGPLICFTVISQFIDLFIIYRFCTLITLAPLRPLHYRTSELWWLSGGKEGILSEQLCAGLCDTMFTVCSTLMWAVLTGQTDWVCHIGTLTLCIEAVA